MRVSSAIGLVFVFIAFCFALDWIATGENFFLYRFWAPKFEDVRRDTYTHTQSYRQGSTQRLDTLCTQMSEADDDHKSLYRATIKNEFAEWDNDDVPAYLHPCLRSARGF